MGNQLWKSRNESRSVETTRPIGRKAASQATPGKPVWRIGALIGVAVAATVAIASDMFSSADNVSVEQAQQIEQQYEAALSQGARLVTPVNFLDPNERSAAKAATGLRDQEAEQLLREAEGGLVMLGWITVWDNQAEDGDVVEVSTNGMRRTVPIVHTPTKIVVPYSLDAGTITLRGLHDGGGGITIAAETSAGALPLPPLAEGEVRTLRIQ